MGYARTVGGTRRWLGWVTITAGVALAAGACSSNDASTGDAGSDSGAPTDGAAPSDVSQPTPDASTVDAMNTISGWMNSCLPYGNPTGTFRTEVLQAIVDACDAFGPPEATNPGWKKEYCWAHMMGAILAESSYDPTAIAAAGSDPTVGLTQIRFSSVVCDFYTGGPLAVLEGMGCQFPSDFAAHASEACYSSTFWQTTGGDPAHTQWMQTVPCNVGLGVWDYYLYATAGGDSQTTQYLAGICAGKGQSADLATGLCSYLEGPNKSFASITSMSAVPQSASGYVTKIKGLMDCALGTVSGTHPLFIPLTPNPPQYCK
jgi:hypothetical protein